MTNRSEGTDKMTAGEEGSRPRDEPELLTLREPGGYYDAASWCVTNITRLGEEGEEEGEMFSSWDGATAALVDSLEFSRTTKMTVHHQELFQSVLLCGGASREYQVYPR